MIISKHLRIIINNQKYFFQILFEHFLTSMNNIKQLCKTFWSFLTPFLNVFKILYCIFTHFLTFSNFFECFWTFFYIFEHNWIFWYIFELFWEVLNNFVQFWIILRFLIISDSKTFLNNTFYNLLKISENFKTILNNFDNCGILNILGAFLNVFEHLCNLFNTFGHFQTFLNIFKHFWTFSDVCE